MKEVMAKIDELVWLLEKKIAECSKKEEQLSSMFKSFKADEEKLIIREKDLDVREDAIKFIEDAARVMDEAKAKLAFASDVKRENEKAFAEIEAGKKSNKDLDEKLQTLIALYRAKNASLEEEKVQLAKDRKEMRSKILEELKNLK